MRRWWAWLCEDGLHNDIQQYGMRVRYRRMFLVLGNLTLVALLCLQAQEYATESVLSEVQHALENFGANVTWPTGSGTILNDAFDQYGETRWSKFALQWLAAVLCWAALVWECTRKTRQGLRQSRMLLYVASGLIYASSVIPVLPNYLQSSKILTILPDCAPKFNMAVHLLTEDLVGVLSILFVVSLNIPILLCVPAAIARTVLFLLESLELQPDWERILDTADIRNTLEILLNSCVIIGPLLTLLPLAVTYQVFQDWEVYLFSLLLWIGPVLLWRYLPAHRLLLRYVAFMLCYAGAVLGLCLVVSFKHNLTSLLSSALSQPDTYVGLVAEVCLAMVVLSDVIFSQVDFFIE
eukprot:m.261760 g.261760  ORF g.261760 m.261760 type:complete len:352 (+) comp22753_c0_seq1:6053-7108(+)